MATKNFGSTSSPHDPIKNDSATNIDIRTNTTSYADLLKGDANSDLRSRLWSELVSRDAREQKCFL